MIGRNKEEGEGLPDRGSGINNSKMTGDDSMFGEWKIIQFGSNKGLVVEYWMSMAVFIPKTMKYC